MLGYWEVVVLELAGDIQKWVAQATSGYGSPVLHVLNDVPTPDEPLLEIEIDRREILRLEPAAFAAHRVPTVVYLYAYPSLRRALLVGPESDGTWSIQSSEGVPMNSEWNGPGFLKLVRALAESHVPSGV